MRLCDLLIGEKVAGFAAIPLSECNITKPRLISDAPKDCFAIMMTTPYPYRHEGGRAFASFSLIPDYHAFFSSLGDKAARLIGNIYGERYIAAFADHSPIDERHAAASVGLGVIGDNGLLVTKGYGSFVFIGELIVEMSSSELEAEGIVIHFGERGECIHCGRCREVCPAGCIGGDKSRCVSALTQKKGLLTEFERDIIRKSSYVWGCDRCAEVCPYFTIKHTDYPELFTKNVLVNPDFSDIEKMRDEEYARYPFSWRRKEIIKRNFDVYDD